MAEGHITLHEAQAVLDAEARTVFEKQLHPDGHSFELFVHDPRRFSRSLPNVGIRLWANHTWEYTNGPEEEEDPDNQPQGDT